MIGLQCATLQLFYTKFDLLNEYNRVFLMLRLLFRRLLKKWGRLMSWEYDKGLIIFLGILVVFIGFCVLMAIRSAKRQKLETQDEKRQRTAKNQIMTRYGVILFFAVLWFASGVLMFSLHRLDLLTGNEVVKLPRVLVVFYDLFGITGGAIIQCILSLFAIVLTIRLMSEKRRGLQEDFGSER